MRSMFAAIWNAFENPPPPSGAAGSSGSSTTWLASSIHFSLRVTLSLISPDGVQIPLNSRFHPLPSTDSTRPDYTNISQTLSRTVFVDIEAVRSNTTRIRVPEHHCQSYPTKSPLDAWEKHTGLYKIDTSYVYCWWEFVQGLIYSLLDIPAEHIRRWNLSRREPLVDPENPSGWLEFTRDIQKYTFEDPNYQKQIGTPLRAPTAIDQGELDRDSVYDPTNRIRSRIKHSEIRDDDLSSVAGAVAGGNPGKYR